MNLGGNRRWAPLRKSGTNHLILGIGISPTSPPGLFPTHFLREKPCGRGWYLANLYDRGKGGRRGKGATPNPSAWFDKEKKPLALRVFGDSSHCTVTLGNPGTLVLACGRSHERQSAGHYKDLTEAGNRARKVSGTQGTALFVTQFL